jgi:hypothetical protein
MNLIEPSKPTTPLSISILDIDSNTNQKVPTTTTTTMTAPTNRHHYSSFQTFQTPTTHQALKQRTNLIDDDDPLNKIFKTSNSSISKLYSGKKKPAGSLIVPKLFDICKKVLAESLDTLHIRISNYSKFIFRFIYFLMNYILILVFRSEKHFPDAI